MIEELRKDIEEVADPKKGEFLQRFFSVQDRARGDIFKGLTVPQSRVIAKKYKQLSLKEIQELLEGGIHEERLIGLLILFDQYKKADEKKKEGIVNFYLKNTEFVNHWDLVDSSAHQILGNYLIGKPKDILYKLAESKIWWERRIAIISTFEFLLLKKETADLYKISTILLHDKHDLIQKAVGWMLREAGKRVSEKELMEFLNKNYKEMPRTTLRYSIERFPEEIGQKYLKGLIK